MNRSMRCALTCLAFAAEPALARDQLEPNQVRIEYLAPKNPAHYHIHDRLKEARVLERIAEFLSAFRLPRELQMKVEGCNGTVNAYYEDATVQVCYEYIEYIYENTPKEPVTGGLKPEDYVIGPTVDVFLHEFAHALFDLLEIPVLGREEDAADLFSAYLQLRVGRNAARVLILGTAFLGYKEIQETMKKSLELKDFANEHGLPAQRYFNLLCMAYGFDRELFADAVVDWHLPPERAEGCENEYEQFHHAYQKLIEPYVDPQLLTSVRDAEWLQFVTQK